MYGIYAFRSFCYRSVENPVDCLMFYLSKLIYVAYYQNIDDFTTNIPNYIFKRQIHELKSFCQISKRFLKSVKDF